MAVPLSPDRSPRHTDTARADADAALARTLEAELTRAATRRQPSLDTPSPFPPSPARQHVGSIVLLALLNVVLFGFIVIRWNLPGEQPAAAIAPLAPDAGIARAAVPPATGVADAHAPRPAAAATEPRDNRNDDRAGERAGARVAISPPADVRSPPRAAAPRPPAASSASRRTAADGTGRPTEGREEPVRRLMLPPLPMEAVRQPEQPSAPSVAVPSPVSVAGEDGVTMPERLPASYVQPTIAALPGGEPATGEVRLSGVVRTDGSVQDLSVINSTRRGAGLEEAALDAVRRWRYKPATRDGQPVDARLTITVTFR